MKKTIRDFLILTGSVIVIFTAAYLWLQTDTNSSTKKESIIPDSLGRSVTTSLESKLTFIHTDTFAIFADSVMERFNPHITLEFSPEDIKVIDGSPINAFTTVGDGIYLYRGLIEELDHPDLIAAVIAHELGHIAHNHVEERLKVDLGSRLLMSILTGGNEALFSELGLMMLNLNYSRSQESEADTFALNLLRDAGISTDNMARVFMRFKTASQNRPEVEFLSSHPVLNTRIVESLEFEDSLKNQDQAIQINWENVQQSIKEW